MPYTSVNNKNMISRNGNHIMKKKAVKYLLATVLSVTCLFGSDMFAAPGLKYVFAGEQLGENDFDDGKGLPWHIVESATGEMEFEIADGVYRITIVNPGGASNGGEDRWDCQFRHRGLTIVQGHNYHVHYEIKASNTGKYYTKIGNLDGTKEIWHNMSNGSDLDSTWDPISYDTADQWKTVDLSFTANQSMDVAEWAFHLGGDGQYTNGVCFPAGTVIEFDNMSLIDESSDENDYVAEVPWVRSDILTNQVSYFEGMQKKATMLCSDNSPVKFSLLDENGKEVWNGKSKPAGHDADSDDDVHILDFSEYDKAGRYTLKAGNGAVSREFSIGDSETYSAMLYDSLNYFYQNRSGVPIESQFITSGDKDRLARAAGHSSDNAQIVSSFTDNTAVTGQSQDVTGGWYDAGDHGKYVVNGGISLWLLQNMYEAALKTGNEKAYADGCMNIPENNNGYPDILDEARFEMDWIQTMLVKEGEYKGMVYHKVHDDKWTGLGIAPSDDDKTRVILPPSTAATLNAAACGAQAARLWKGIDDAYSKQCLEFAKTAYEAAKAHPDQFAPSGNFEGGGAYGDDDVSDEFYWAAAELYITTGEAAYHDDMKGSGFFLELPTVLSGGESVDTCGGFDWGHTAALGTISIAINDDKVDKADAKSAAAAIISSADEFIKTEDKQGYGLPYGQSTLSSTDSDTGYIWGSNSLVADNGIVLAYAYILNGDAKYLNGAVSAMDYLLGRNAMDYSYVTGYGTHAAKYPHHRYWANLIDDSFPLAPNGVLVGGPNSGMEDPWVRGSGWKKGAIPPAKCYMDHIEAYSANECTINWNAPLAWLTAFITENTKEGIKQGAVNLSPAAVPSSSETKINEAAGTAPANNGENPSPSEQNASEKGAKGEKQGVSMWIIALIILAVVVILVTAEILIYKFLKSRKANYTAVPSGGTDQTGNDTASPSGGTDLSSSGIATTMGDTDLNSIDTASPSGSTYQNRDPEFLYDAYGQPQMRILYDSEGNPVYLPLK